MQEGLVVGLLLLLSRGVSMKNYLLSRKTPSNADLIDRILVEYPNIELQANVRTDRGVPNGKGRLDGDVKFWNDHYPKDAKDCPKWNKPPTWRYPLDEYVQEVGTTGFSRSGNQQWGYDLDAVFGHGKGLSDHRLKQIQAAVEPLDYVEIRRSTRGKGIHLYIRGKIDLANHTEHAAVGRALLGKLCLGAGLDFAHDVDVCGGNMWFVSRRATAENQGFELLKPATRTLSTEEIPANWRDHLDVVNRKRARVALSNDDQAAELATTTVADQTHKRILAELQQTGYALLYVPDYACWHCHTKALEIVHKKLGLKGYYETVSDGSDPATPNCYIFLRPDGMLYVVRFNCHTEHSSWARTENGDAACLYNRPVDLKTACTIVSGVWTGAGCTCHTLAQAAQLAALFGFDLPQLQNERPITFKHMDSHTICAETAQIKGETILGWGLGFRKLVVTFDVEPNPEDEHDYDVVGRHVVTVEKENAGWLMRTDDKEWIFDAKDTVIDRVCDYFDIPSRQRSNVAGRIASRPYRLVSEPYQPEFLPDRQWNKFGAQLAVAPTYGGIHPHYDRILRHVGAGLDKVVKENAWCQQWGITTGYQFLLLWCALLVRRPKQHLPMLYLYSYERDNGKSAFYKALGLLFAKGFVAGVSLLNERFNKMMAGAVLVYLDEEKISPEQGQKVKVYIDADNIPLRMMRTDAFMFPNVSHWIATYNFDDGVPVEDGDERVIMLEVPVLYDEDKIPWREVMLPALESERSDFLGTLMTTNLPTSNFRLYLPILETPLKNKGNASQFG
jgi:hypothetical protein